jgi:Zn-dependent protease
MGLAFFAVFLFSTTLHEAAHAWTALRGGDNTAYLGGQVSLDPIPHMRREPFGMVILPLLTSLTMGFPMGYASAPYDPRWARKYPRRAAVMALAGPAANLAVVLLCFALIRIGVFAEVFVPPPSVNFGALTASESGAVWSTIGTFLSIGFSLNLLLCVFNLLPFPPLDGSAAITLLMSKKLTARYQLLMWGTPSLAFIGIFMAWKPLPPVFWPIFRATFNLLYPGVTYG